MTERIDEKDLPRVSPAPTSHVRAVQGGKSVLIPLPEVTNAAALVAEAIEGIKDAAQAEAELILGGLGYLPPVAFGSGLNVDSTRFTVTYNGVTYAPVADEVPFTTTGAFDPGQWRVIQGVTAADLSLPSAAGMIGFKQVGFDAVTRNSEDKLREWVTPEDYGAVGDGVADDTEPVQNAINVGRVVRFRPGATYRITSSLIVPSNTTIIAHGAKVIRGATGLNNLIRNYADGVTGGTDAATNITIDGGDWDGGDDSQGVLTVMAFGHCNRITVRNATIRRVPHWHHIELNGAADVLIENCRFVDGASYGVDTGEAIQLDHASNSTSFPWFGPYDGTACGGVRISNCSFSYNSSGIGTHSTPGTGRHQDIVIESCSFFGIYGYGIRMRQWAGVRVVNCRFQNCYTGIRMESFNGQVPRDVLIQGNTFYNIGAGGNPGTDGVCINISGASEDARYADVRIVGNFISGMDGSHGASALVAFYTDRLMVEGNTITSPVLHGMWLQGIKNSVISGNSCYGAASPNFDIRLGYASSSTVTVDNIVTGNTCGRIGVSNTTRCLVRDNVASSVDVTGSHTGTVTTGNLVSGTMT